VQVIEDASAIDLSRGTAAEDEEVEEEDGDEDEDGD
jgi:hypothetical protein